MIKNLKQVVYRLRERLCEFTYSYCGTRVAVLMAKPFIIHGICQNKTNQ